MTVNTDISCALPRPDIAELSEAVRTEFSKRLLGGAPVLPLSSEDVLAFVMAGTVNLMHGFITQSLKEQDPAQMCCDNLTIYAARHGINMKSATRSKGYAAITGDPNALIPPTLRFVGQASREYKLDPGVTFNPTRLDPTGAAVVRIVANIGGPQFDMQAGEALTVSTTTPGIDMEATVVGNGIIGGSNDEDCETLRRRVIASEANGIISTNRDWYIQKTMTYPGVTRACDDECGACCDPQHTTLFPFFENTYGDYMTEPYGVPPQEVIDEMNLWMWGRDDGKGQGLAPVAIVGSYERACPTIINVTLYCFKGCAEATRARIEDAMRSFIRSRYCVGSTICKEELRSIARETIGRDTCFSEIRFAFSDLGVRYEDDAFFYLSCGHFPVLGAVTLDNRAIP